MSTQNNNHEENLDFDLAQLDEAYGGAVVENRDVPDGKYTVKIDKIELKTSKTSGLPMLSFQFVILAPTSVGRRLFLNRVIQNKAEALSWLKKDLQTCGYFGSLSGLKNSLADFLDVVLEIQAKTGTNGSQNIYLNKLVGKGEEAVTTVSAADDLYL